MKSSNLKKMTLAVALTLLSSASAFAQNGFTPPILFPGGINGTTPIVSQPNFLPTLQNYQINNCNNESACLNAINTAVDLSTGVSLVLGQELHNTQFLLNGYVDGLYQRINHTYLNSQAYTRWAIANIPPGVSFDYVDMTSAAAQENAITEANGYTANQVSNLNLIIKQQIGEAKQETINLANAHTNNIVSVTSENDRAYTDAVGASAIRISGEHADKAVEAALITANANAQSYATNALKSANGYAESITSAALVTSVKQAASYTDGVAASTLRSANEFTNATARENRQYTDTAVNQSEVRQTAYTNQVASKVREEMGFMNKRTQDEANAGIAAAAAAPTAPGGQGRWIGGGLSRYRNAVALGVTGSYEDANSRTFSASLSRSLSGGGGTLLTLKAGTKF